MKAAAFDYVRPDSIDEVLEVLHESGPDAKLIAGGQSLVPMMAMRLVRPALLVDINRIAELKQLEVGPHSVTMGAGFRQRVLEDTAELAGPLPLPKQALQWVGHVQTRNRGTVGGSLVHADPTAEQALAALMLNATLHLRSANGEREVAAEDFFHGPMYTAVAEDECLHAIDWPRWTGGGVRTAFDETAMRQGDFAMAAAACQLQMNDDGTCRRAAIGLGGMDITPRAFPDIAAQLEGRRIDAATAREIAHAAVAHTSPGSDLHAGADYRRELGTVLLERVLLQAAART